MKVDFECLQLFNRHDPALQRLHHSLRSVLNA
jgi:hypothetical protein